MVIERRGIRTGLITTAGMRDVLEIGRQTRPNLYDYSVHNPAPLVPRELRFEVEERVDASGNVVQKLDRQSLVDAIEGLKKTDVEAVAICFLHSYKNPDMKISPHIWFVAKCQTSLSQPLARSYPSFGNMNGSLRRPLTPMSGRGWKSILIGSYRAWLNSESRRNPSPFIQMAA